MRLETGSSKAINGAARESRPNDLVRDDEAAPPKPQRRRHGTELPQRTLTDDDGIPTPGSSDLARNPRDTPRTGESPAVGSDDGLGNVLGRYPGRIDDDVGSAVQRPAP